MIVRSIKEELSALANKIGVISIIGPRQSGKTTLVKQFFANHMYYNLEDPVTRALIMEDPKGFIYDHNEGIIFDEVQKYPELLSYIQVAIDETFKPARFVITGSENLLLSEKIRQSLAGRVAIFQLLPLSIGELVTSNLICESHYKQMLYGFYPRIYDQELSPSHLYPDYVASYVERDVRQVKNIGDLTNFQRFLQLMAGRVGRTLTVSDLSSDLGVNYKTVESWISILETTYIVFRLQPYYENYGKRTIKSSKIYFYDTGLLCYLLGIDGEKEMMSHYALGNLFENMIVADVKKQLLNHRSSSQLYFWSDSERNEVDLLIKNGDQLYPLEIKAGRTFSSDYIKGIKVWNSARDREELGHVIYTGENLETRSIRLLNWKSVSDLTKYLV